MSAILRVEHLEVLSLPPTSFALEKGRCLAVLGTSGVGKSLLLKSIADLVAPQGKIFFKNQERETVTATQWRKNIRYCAAETGWWADAVWEHFANIEAIKKRLPEFGLKQEVLEQLVSTLSTGQRQRLGLLRAMSDKPPVLLLDEPTAALDAKNKELIELVLRRAMEQGAALVMITHDKAQAKRLGNDLLTLSADKITMEAI